MMLFNEFLGTFLHIYITLLTGNAIASGISLIIVLLFLNGYFNPALLLAFTAMNKINVNESLKLLFMQVLGGLVAWQVVQVWRPL